MEHGMPAKRIIVAGVSSSGKTTVAQALALRLGARFLDADDFHPPANVRKMASGMPLDDSDRWPWLDRLNAELREAAAKNEAVVLACSALRQAYRNRLADGVDDAQLVLLTGRKELLAQRAAARAARARQRLGDRRDAAGRRDRRRTGAATGRRGCRRGYSPASLSDSDHAPPARKASEVASGGP
jgi:carbohydrate kinase (thermoresistant glucokinase family)